MSSYRNISPVSILNQVVSTGIVPSKPLIIPTLTVTGFLITVGSGLHATFQMMVSMDGVLYYDSGQVIDPAVGSPTVIPVNPPPQGFPFVLIQTTWGSGSANVSITGSAKT